MPLLTDNVRALYAALVVAALAIAGLSLGKEVLIPLAISACIAFVLSPIVNWLTARRVPHAAAVASLVMALVVVIAGLSTLLASQLISLTGSLTTYQANLVEKVRTLVGTTTKEGAIKRAADAVEALQKGIAKELQTPAERTAPKTTPTDPIVVVPEKKAPIWSTPADLLHPLAQVGLTFLFTFFMLLQAQDLRDRIVRIAGADNVSGTTAALSDAASGLSKLFLAQAAMNAGFGVTVGLALWFIGVPNSALWGALAFLMRFVPYIGSFIAAVPPILLAAAVDPGWGMAIATACLFVVGEAIMGQVVEPLVLGPQAGLSPLAMLVSAGFWALVWGPVGLVLAAPLTMTMVVLGRYIKGLEFITVLLGDEPALSPEQQLYHRLLSGDTLAAVQQIDAAAAERSPADVGDAIVLPALRLASADIKSGRIDRGRAAQIQLIMSDVTAQIEMPQPRPAEVNPKTFDRAIMVVPARTAVDVAAAEFVARTIRLAVPRAVSSVSESTGLSALSQAASRSREAIDAIVIVAIAEADAQYLPLIAKRASSTFPAARVILLDAGTGTRVPADTFMRYTKLRELWAALSLLETGDKVPVSAAPALQ